MLKTGNQAIDQLAQEASVARQRAEASRPVMGTPKMIAFRLTAPSQQDGSLSADFLPVLRKFTDRLDEMDPLHPPKKWAPGDSVLVYPDPLKGLSVDEFVADMLESHDLVLAWYEAKKVQVKNWEKKKGAPEFVDKTYHNFPFFFIEKGSAKCNERFAPRRPAVLAEFMAMINANTLDLRTFHDNAMLTAAGEKDDAWRRWEMSFNNVQPLLGQPKTQLHFRGA